MHKQDDMWGGVSISCFGGRGEGLEQLETAYKSLLGVRWMADFGFCAGQICPQQHFVKSACSPLEFDQIYWILFLSEFWSKMDNSTWGLTQSGCSHLWILVSSAPSLEAYLLPIYCTDFGFICPLPRSLSTTHILHWFWSHLPPPSKLIYYPYTALIFVYLIVCHYTQNWSIMGILPKQPSP